MAEKINLMNYSVGFSIVAPSIKLEFFEQTHIVLYYILCWTLYHITCIYCRRVMWRCVGSMLVIVVLRAITICMPSQWIEAFAPTAFLLVSTGANLDLLCHRMKLHTQCSFVTWLRVVKLKEINIWFLNSSKICSDWKI